MRHDAAIRKDFFWLKGVKLDKGVQCSSFAGKWQRPQHIRTVFAMLTLSKGKYLTQVWGKFCSFFAMHRNGDYWHTVRVDHPASSPHALSVSLQYHYDIKQVKLLMVMQRWVSMRGWENVEDFLPVIRTYSEKFIATLNEQEPEDLTDLSPPYVTSTWLCFALFP
jgi:hypothetical protein